ncbi:MAG: molybdopterin-binding protein [Thermodesulfovibrionales bacterium]|jgi:putative molybdopterin biosynthesis protein
MSRNIYLENTPLSEALSRWLTRLDSEGITTPFSGDTVSVTDALGRVTAEAVIARVSSPFYHSSAMDGYAVRFTDTFGASERTPMKLRIGSGAVPVNTGDPMPDGFNAVIMIEDVNIIRAVSKEHGVIAEEYSEIITPATPWQHVRIIGEDIVATELILPENQKVRPVDIGAMLAGGHIDVKVRRKPKVIIIPTGDEIVEPGSELKKGDIIEYNSRVLGGLVSEWGGEYDRYRIVPDSLEELKKAVLDAHAMGDIIVVNAGSSAGSEDFTAEAIRGLGEVLLHGINIKPGKPVILGIIKGKPVLGIPGYPVSAYITFNLFVKPIVYKWLGLDINKPETLVTKISRQVASTAGQEEFLGSR